MGHRSRFSRSNLARLALLLLLLPVLPLLHPATRSTATPSDTPATTWITDGPVYAVLRSGTTVYLGGDFTYVGPPTGSFVALDPTSGARDASWPAVNGTVFAVVSDGSGGWFIGGDFTKVGGLPRTNLAQIKSDKTVDPAFTPNPNAPVNALALSGDTYDSEAGATRRHRNT
ncbi:MAG: hypothetical protein KatS3mg060_3393 [Dehalococcoidia bacterium]|nr:MAG: hypothetical protein KatS3mg060_3393 [Dehalococcoidia bacterium]